MQLWNALMNIRSIVTGILLVGLLGGCGGSGGSSAQTGTLSVGLTDATVDRVEELRLYVSGVTVKPENGPPQSYPVKLTECAGIPGETDTCNPVNLLALQGGLVLTVLANQQLPAGRYQWLRLEIDEAQAYVVEDTGLVDSKIEVRVPSQRGLQLSGGFVILAGESTDLVMDWDARQGLTNPVGQDGYILKPSIRLVDMAQYGTLAGSVSQCVDTGVVYVFEGDATQDPENMLDDIDNNEPNPLVTASVVPVGSGFGYEVHYLPVGTYTITLVCDTDGVPASDTNLQEADDEIEFIAPQLAEIEDGLTRTIDF
jgi:hypothetical protein